MNEVGWIILTIFTGNLVYPWLALPILTSKAHNLCKLTFHKTKNMVIIHNLMIDYSCKKVTNCECLLQLHHENYCTIFKESIQRK